MLSSRPGTYAGGFLFFRIKERHSVGIVVLVAVLFVALISMGVLWLWYQGGKIGMNIVPRGSYGAVLLHTSCPRHGRIPDFGTHTAKVAAEEAKRFDSLIILSVGRTVPEETRTEGEIYRDWLRSRFRKSRIVVGTDKSVRDTYGEIGEAIKICDRLNLFSLLVVAKRSHLWRVRRYWKAYGPGVETAFVAVSCPVRCYIQELCVILTDAVCSPGSVRHARVLDFIGRRG